MLTASKARALFQYDPATGILRWRESGTGRRLDLIAGYRQESGYHYVRIDYKMYCVHRVIWLMTHGEWPLEIDHINGDRGDNRLCNLRNADRTTNNRNRARHKNNTSGRGGVYRDRGRYWHARGFWYDSDGKQRSKTLYHGKSWLLAVLARAKWEADRNFHPNHDRHA